MKNVVPFRAPEPFAKCGIDWTKEPRSERERALREAYLLYETSCGPDGLVALLLLSVVSRRQGGVARDLQDAADHAEILLAMKLHKHEADALEQVQSYLAEGGELWR
jgi:hypothetical protein